MLEKLKANLVFEVLLKRHNIDKAYAMVGPEDSWYDTITTVHNSLAKIKELPHEQWEITSHDGLKLKGLFYPGGSDKTMIWVHGYTSHAERESAFPGLFYLSMGYNVLVPYLRAHGPSEGKYISFGALETKDMLRWVDKVNEHYPEGRILLHGLSMGGGIVLNMSATEMKNVRCMVADAPNLDITNAFWDITGQIFKKKRDKVLPFLLRRFKDTFGVDTDDYDSLQAVASGRYPLLLSAGSNEHLDEKLAAVKEKNPQPTTVVILPGCNHGNGMYKQTEMYQGAIRAFVEEYIGI